MNKIWIDGVSSDTVRLRFDKIPLFPAAEQRTQSYSIPNAGEDMTVETVDFNDVSLTLTAYLVGGTTIEDVYTWLRSGDKLTLSTQPSIYSRIKHIGEVAPSRVGWDAHKIDIPLTLSPFKYLLDGTPVLVSSSPAQIENRGNHYSVPLYTLTGCSGDVTFSVNGVELLIEDAPDTVYIDTQTQEVYTMTGSTKSSIMDTTTGDFWDMALNPGNNSIQWSGTVFSVYVLRRERWV